MLYKQVCNEHGDKSNRWSLGLSLSMGGVTSISSSPLCATMLTAAYGVARITVSKYTLLRIQQVALLWQRDRARHLSVEIMQLQNISLENPIVWHYLRDCTFSRFDTIPTVTDTHTHTECMQTDRHTTTAYTALSIALHSKNRPYCTAHQL